MWFIMLPTNDTGIFYTEYVICFSIGLLSTRALHPAKNLLSCANKSFNRKDNLLAFLNRFLVTFLLCVEFFYEIVFYVLLYRCSNKA